MPIRLESTATTMMLLPAAPTAIILHHRLPTPAPTAIVVIPRIFAQIPALVSIVRRPRASVRRRRRDLRQRHVVRLAARATGHVRAVHCLVLPDALFGIEVVVVVATVAATRQPATCCACGCEFRGWGPAVGVVVRVRGAGAAAGGEEPEEGREEGEGGCEPGHHERVRVDREVDVVPAEG